MTRCVCWCLSVMLTHTLGWIARWPASWFPTTGSVTWMSTTNTPCPQFWCVHSSQRFFLFLERHYTVIAVNFHFTHLNPFHDLRFMTFSSWVIFWSAAMNRHCLTAHSLHIHRSIQLLVSWSIRWWRTISYWYLLWQNNRHTTIR